MSSEDRLIIKEVIIEQNVYIGDGARTPFDY
jgi:hypothetical protein